MKANLRLMKDMEQSYKEKLQEAKVKAATEKEESSKKKSEPHLMNLNEDPLLTAKVFYSVNRGKTHFSRFSKQFHRKCVCW